MKTTISVRIEKSHDDYVKEVASNVCSISEVYREIVSDFCNDYKYPIHMLLV